MRLKAVHVTADLVAHMLTQGYSMHHMTIQEGLPKGARLMAVSLYPEVALGGVPGPVDRVLLLFEHESFPDIDDVTAAPPVQNVVVALRQEHGRPMKNATSPRMLEELYDGYVRTVSDTPALLSQTQHTELRRAFMAGSRAFFSLLASELSPGMEIVPQDISLVECLEEELDQFVGAVERGEK